MPDRNNTNLLRNNSFRRFFAAEACQYVYYCPHLIRKKITRKSLALRCEQFRAMCLSLPSGVARKKGGEARDQRGKAVRRNISMLLAAKAARKGSRHSVMMRIFGSVPLGRTSTRPVPPSMSVTAEM